MPIGQLQALIWDMNGTLIDSGAVVRTRADGERSDRTPTGRA
jgi:beta-phosphoglucomutase-like phosphatase (HAD superfamily)